MKNLKKIVAAALVLIMTAAALASCGGAKKKTVVIWTSGEDYKNEYYLNKLREKFPEYDIKLEYMNSSTIAAKVVEEKDRCEADIICSEEYGYLYKCEDYLAVLEDFDFSVFLDDIVPQNRKFTPELKNGGCIIINKRVIEEKGLSIPASYADLLKPEYKGLISMPSPASSGTGYMFLRQLTNEWGEDAAFDYFREFSKNVLQYTSSGSGPINALVSREVAVGLGMTAQAVVQIQKGYDELEILFFEEGSPYSMYGNAVLKKSAGRESVMKVFDYLATDLCRDNNELFFPDQIYKNFTPTVKGYPENINYGDMSNDTQSEKERLLAKWDF